MKRLLIIGAGGLGRETYQWAIDMQKVERKWDDIGFLDDNKNALDKFNLSHRITGSIRDYCPKPEEYVVCAIGDPLIRTEICLKLLDKEARFANVIHPTVVLSDSCQIGRGVIIGPGTIISSNVKIGDFVIVNSLNTVGHDSSIELGSVLSAHCDVMGFVYLEEQVLLGSGVRILPGKRVGRKATVGAGGVVIKDVKEKTTVFGNPAKAIYNPKGEGSI